MSESPFPTFAPSFPPPCALPRTEAGPNETFFFLGGSDEVTARIAARIGSELETGAGVGWALGSVTVQLLFETDGWPMMETMRGAQADELAPEVANGARESVWVARDTD